MRRKSSQYLSVMLGVCLLSSGCQMAGQRLNDAIVRSQKSIRRLISALFVSQTETPNFSVRVREEFFIHFPNLDETKPEQRQLAVYIRDGFDTAAIDKTLGEWLETDFAEGAKTKTKGYFDTSRYRLFVEPRFLAFYFWEGDMKRKDPATSYYTLSLQTQIFVREKMTGNEIYRGTVSSIGKTTPRRLAEYMNQTNFQADLKEAAKEAAAKLLETVENAK
jgi:hypothetical protein